jgi:hypothetical protein
MDQEQNRQPKTFYAMIELMGHSTVAGLVTETQLAGAGFLQVDILDQDGNTRFQRFIAPQAVYGINPVDKEIAIELCQRGDYSRISAYDVPQIRRLIQLEERERARMLDDEDTPL